MRIIEIGEQKEILKNILREFHIFCLRNKLTYYLTGGTLLGAIRHKGFIPWDDDIDVCMPRNDYERMLDTFNSEKSAFRVHSLRDKGFYLPFAKIVDTRTRLKEVVHSNFELGIYVDVFPIDNMSNDFTLAQRHYRDVTKYRNLLNIKNIEISPNRIWYKNCVLSLGRIVLLGVPRERILNEIDSLSKRYQGNDMTKYVGMVCSAFYGEREILKSEWFKETCLVTFEGEEYFAPINYDAFLKQLYGNYMQLPPIEKRISHHVNTAWMIND